MTDLRKGAQLVMEASVAMGVDVCFANPGTTEMALVAALDKVAGMRSILCLFEGVCTGAADGYGRMQGSPAMTLLHLEPGFANGIANLHNARRAHTPIVNLIGDHASWHLQYDAPLTSDIHSLAKPVSGWVKTVANAGSIAQDFKEAVAASLIAPGCSATIILPTDHQEAKILATEVHQPVLQERTFSITKVNLAADKLKSNESCILLVGGTALTERGQKLTAAIAESTGAKVMVETYPAKIERGQGVPTLGRLPYFPEDVIAAVGDANVILVGTRNPVSYFGYEGLPSELVSRDKLLYMTDVAEDNEGALQALSDTLGAPEWVMDNQSADVDFESGALSPQSIAKLVTMHMPENSIVVPEGSTCSVAFFNAAANGPRHTLLTNTGGAIGQGPALSIGCAIACPDRKVINLQSDGSALYTVQSLWTQARESLDVVTLIVSNRLYSILQVELKRSGQTVPGPQARALTELDNPALDWVSIARGFAVSASRAETTGELEEQIERAMSVSGPHLIEMIL